MVRLPLDSYRPDWFNKSMNTMTLNQMVRHYLSHNYFGWEGYTRDDVVTVTLDVTAQFLDGELTYEKDIEPYCDGDCF